jgi:hypothetical protein
MLHPPGGQTEAMDGHWLRPFRNNIHSYSLRRDPHAPPRRWCPETSPLDGHQGARVSPVSTDGARIREGRVKQLAPGGSFPARPSGGENQGVSAVTAVMPREPGTPWGRF